MILLSNTLFSKYFVNNDPIFFKPRVPYCILKILLNQKTCLFFSFEKFHKIQSIIRILVTEEQNLYSCACRSIGKNSKCYLSDPQTIEKSKNPVMNIREPFTTLNGGLIYQHNFNSYLILKSYAFCIPYVFKSGKSKTFWFCI